MESKNTKGKCKLTVTHDRIKYTGPTCPMKIIIKSILKFEPKKK